jgi:hypothetical protein
VNGGTSASLMRGVDDEEARRLTEAGSGAAELSARATALSLSLWRRVKAGCPCLRFGRSELVLCEAIKTAWTGAVGFDAM